MTFKCSLVVHPALGAPEMARRLVGSGWRPVYRVAETEPISKKREERRGDAAVGRPAKGRRPIAGGLDFLMSLTPSHIGK